MQINHSLLDFKDYNSQKNPVLIKDLMDLDVTQFKNQNELIKFLSYIYVIHPHHKNKIILFDKSNYCYKIGISSNFIDEIVNEKQVLEKAKNNNFLMFFEPIEYLGHFKNFPANGIYRQRKNIVYKDWDYEQIVKNWINLYGVEKLLQFNDFLEQNYLCDLSPNNIGYNLETKAYKIIDYEFTQSGIQDGHKIKFDIALNNCLKE